MAKILVIGYGNPLRSDDGFGLRAVEQLKKDIKGQEVDLVECQQLTPELAERVAKTDLVLFVDADTDGVSGTMHTRRIKASAGQNSDALLHHLDPAGLLGLTQALYKKSPEAMLLTVTGECFGFGKQLSAEVAKALPGVVHHIEEIIEEHVHPKKMAHA
jgi:hydrogenase maturation protease